MSRRVRAVGVVAVAVLLAACGQASDAGDRIPTTPTGSSASGPVQTASADVVAAAALVDCPASDAEVAARADGLPDLSLACLGDGPAVRLAGLRGRPLVLNLWASWCEPCRAELPLFADLSGSAGSSLRVLGIAVQDQPDAALSLLADTDVHYASMRDDEAGTKAPLRWTGLPMTLFVDADGVVTFTQRGVITSDEQLRGLVQEHLGVTVPA